MQGSVGFHKGFDNFLWVCRKVNIESCLIGTRLYDLKEKLTFYIKFNSTDRALSLNRI
jgi:hypothetical protein